MKKAISLLLALVLCLSLCACGKSETVKNVEALIDAIGEVNIDSESTILVAEEAYSALTAEEQAEVSNSSLLLEARPNYVEVLIENIGDVTAESREKIILAEEAYNALSDEDKVSVENSEILSTAWIQYYYACLTGNWYLIGTGEQVFTLLPDRTIDFMGEKSSWKLLGDYILVDLGMELKFDISDIEGILVLENSELGTLVKDENYKELYTEFFVDVELTAENINDYIEFLPYEIEYVDAFGDGTGEYDCGVATSSKVFDDGLVYWSSKDIAIEVLIPNDYRTNLGDTWHWSIYSAGSNSLGWENGKTVVEEIFGAVVYGFTNGDEPDLDFHPEMFSFGKAKGTITFVKAEYVESITNEGCRTITLTNGLSNRTGYWCNGVDWPENILS